PHVSIALQARRDANASAAATGLKQSGHVAATRGHNHVRCPRPPSAAHSFRPQAESPMTIQRSLIATAIATALTPTIAPRASAEPQAGFIAGETVSAGTIVGRVRESTVGASLDGAIVSLDGRQVTTTERSGEFRISGIAPGTYRLTVDYLGYHSVDTEV